MHIFIPQSLAKLIFFITLLSLTLACEGNTAKHLDSYRQKTIVLPNNEEFKVYMADNYPKQKKGLSGIEHKDFSGNEGMFFTGDRVRKRQFWMPETHFNLDIIFLSKNLYVLDIHRNMPHYPKPGPKSKIPLSKEVMSVHVLEVKANTKLAQKIKIGMLLKWKE